MCLRNNHRAASLASMACAPEHEECARQVRPLMISRPPGLTAWMQSTCSPGGHYFQHRTRLCPMKRESHSSLLHRIPLVCLGLLSWVTPVLAQECRVTLVTSITIGDDEPLSDEYIFAAPSDVVTDDQGRIYVADATRGDIKVFNSKGKYLMAIGSRGSGPGEFSEISDIGYATGLGLVVVDRLNDRITYFDRDGQIRGEQRVPGDAIVDLKYVGFRESRHVFYFVDTSAGLRADTPILHWTTEDSETWGGSSVSLSSLHRLEDEVYAVHAVSSRATELSRDESAGRSDQMSVLMAPFYYEGYLVRSEEISPGTFRTRKLSNGRPRVAAYRKIDFDPGDPSTIPPYAHVISGRQAFVLEDLYQTRGVFSTADGRVVVFVVSYDGGQRRLFVDTFGRDGAFLGRYLVDGAPNGPRMPIRSFLVRWKDAKDLFYAIETASDGAPFVRGFTLSGLPHQPEPACR